MSVVGFTLRNSIPQKLTNFAGRETYTEATHQNVRFWELGMYSRNSLASVLIASGLLMGAQRASASAETSSSSSGAALDEIIVTAEKRSESINDVGMSITAATGLQLQKLGVTDVADFTKVVPGFTYENSVYGTPVYTLRGVGFNDYIMGSEPAVSVYIDQAPLPYSIMTKGVALDVERVEVLKGPQGTLFGENSTGGAINFIPASPTDTFHSGVDVSYGRFNDVTTGGFISGPITDALTARFALSHESADGWQYSDTRPSETNGRKDFTQERLLVDWHPIEDLHFRLNVNGWHDTGDSEAAQFERFKPKDPANPLTQFIYNAILPQPVAPANDRVADWQPGFNFTHDDSFYQIALRGDWNVRSNLTLTSITSYSQLDANEPIDTDGTTICNFCWTAQDGHLTSISEELRLAGENGPLRWMAGGNYQDQVADQTDVAVLNSTGTTIPTPDGPFYIDHVRNTLNQEPITKAGFGSLDYSVTNQFTFQASARYTHQRRTLNGCLADDGAGPYGVRIGTPLGILSSLLSGSPTTVPEGGCVTLSSTTFKPVLVTSSMTESNLSWRVGANWKPQEDTLVYANAARGFKAGGYTFTGGNSTAEFAQPVNQESVLAYEVGYKRSFLQRRVDVTAALYYYDYDDKQFLGVDTYPIFGNLPTLINIPKSYIVGGELNLVVRPVEGLTLSLGGTYVKSRVKTAPSGPTLDGYGNEVSYVGESFPETPKWQGVGDIEYDFPLTGDFSGMVGGTVTARSASQSVFGGNADFTVNSYVLLDVRAGVQTNDGRWRAWLWGRNVTDKYYWTNVTFLVDTLDRLAGMPATFGASLSYRY